MGRVIVEDGTATNHAIEVKDDGVVRTFATGATRSSGDNKPERQYGPIGPQEELIWAAGLFEGEGSLGPKGSGKRRKDGTCSQTERLYLATTDKDVLDRFHRAMGMRGSIAGPYLNDGRNKPIWHWTATWRSAREIAPALYPYMCERRALRFLEVFGEDILVPSNGSNPPAVLDSGTLRTFETGATRSSAEGKADYEGFLSPQVIARFGAYMVKHQFQADGTLRTSDNWQKGIPRDQYMKSLLRHVFELWTMHRGGEASVEFENDHEAIVETVCAILFNSQGYLFEYLNDR